MRVCACVCPCMCACACLSISVCVCACASMHESAHAISVPAFLHVRQPRHRTTHHHRWVQSYRTDTPLRNTATDNAKLRQFLGGQSWSIELRAHLTTHKMYRLSFGGNEHNLIHTRAWMEDKHMLLWKPSGYNGKTRESVWVPFQWSCVSVRVTFCHIEGLICHSAI